VGTRPSRASWGRIVLYSARWGLEVSISSGMMPSRMNQTERVERWPRALEAKGVPLSERIRCGRPYSPPGRADRVGFGGGREGGATPRRTRRGESI
jgi:hypothetical protein